MSGFEVGFTTGGGIKMFKVFRVFKGFKMLKVFKMFKGFGFPRMVVVWNDTGKGEAAPGIGRIVCRSQRREVRFADSGGNR